MISANLFYYPYEYMGECEMFNEIQLPEKEPKYGGYYRFRLQLCKKDSPMILK